MTIAEPTLPAPIDARALLGAILDKIDTAVCLFDASDRVVLWNDAYLRFFPEEVPILRPGLPYAETLRRYFEANLPTADEAMLQRHMEAGLERHRQQRDPYIYQRRDGRWFEVRSHRLEGGLLLKVWADVTDVQAAQSVEFGVAQAVAADIGIVQYDAQARLVLVNRAMGELFPSSIDLFRPGVPYAEHLRRYADDELDAAERPRLERLAARPDPLADLAAEPQIFHRRDGGWLQLEERAAGERGLTSLWTDVTGRMNVEAQVSQLRSRLIDAIESLDEGFALYDREDRLVLCNSRYRELNAPIADLLVPGARWEDVLEIGVAQGQYPDATGREAEWLAERRAQRQRVGEPIEMRLRDERWMRVVDWRTSDGGMVGICSDITARKRHDAELVRRTAMLHAISYAATMIVGQAGWRAGVQQLLSKLGEAAEVSRVTIFQVHEHPTLGLVQSCRYDWAEPGLDTLSDDPQNWNQSLTEGEPLFLEWTERRRSGHPIQVMTRDLTGFLRDEFERHGTRSFVSVPIFVNGEWWGHIGFDDCKAERAWNPLELDVLNTAGTLIAWAVERAQVEDRLRLSEERYRRLVYHLPHGVLLHDRQGITFLNPAGCAILGLASLDEARGRSYTDFLIEENAADRDAIRHALEAGTEIPLSQHRVRTHDGRTIFVGATAVPFSFERTPSALVLFRDITSRIEAERELAQYRGHLEELVAERTNALVTAEQRLMAAINTFKGGFALYDADERLVVVNEALIEFSPELAGILKRGALMQDVMRAIAAVRGLDEQWVTEELTRFRGPQEYNEERTLADGRCIQLSVRHPPDGSTLVIATDITPYRDAADALRKALAKEKQLGQLQREFISMTSHEFRTPLAIIDASTQRLMRRRASLTEGEFNELGAEIRAAIARMVGHIDSILSTSRLDPGRIRLVPKPCDLRAILQEVCRRHQALTAQHRFDLDLDDLPETILGDPQMLDQMATNIVSNAVKYSPDGGAIAVRAWRDGADAVWSVADQGVGIPSEDLPRIAERFYRARTSVGIAGTGLGLSLVNELVTLHGGSMDIASTEGQGTTVTVRLPVAGPPRAAQDGREGADGDHRLH